MLVVCRTSNLLQQCYGERENTVADFNYQHEAPLWEFSTGIFLDLDDVTGGIDDIADPDEHIDFGASGVGL